MRRVLIGAVAFAVAALAAIGIVARRRWGVREELLQVEPPPPASTIATGPPEPADFGPLGSSPPTEPSPKPRTRSTRTTAGKAGPGSAASTAPAAKPRTRRRPTAG